MSYPDNTIVAGAALGKRYGPRWILSAVNINIKKGEVVALFGNNGSGKTTLLRLIATLASPSVGTLQVLGCDPTRDKPKIRQRLRFLGHNKQLYERLSVLENLKLAARIRGLVDRHTAADLTALQGRLQLAAVQDRPVSELSEGMKKRLVLARLLLGDPELILLDEPHPTLDTQGRQILNDLIGEWKGRGKTIVIASHDHVEVLRHANRLIVLQGGTVHYDGAPKDPMQIV